MTIRRVLVLLALAGSGVSAAQRADQTPPPVPADLAAARQIPTLEVFVTDPEGRPLPQVAVNFRDLKTRLTGGGATDLAGRYTRHPGLEWSPSSGWHFSWIGPHQIEVIAPGFLRWVAEPVDLVPGRTHQLRVALERRTAPVLLDRVSYQRLAAERVLMLMRGGKQGRVAIVAGPIELPEFARALPARDPRRLPEAFVQAATYVDGKFREPVVVRFQDGQPEVRFSYISDNGFLDLEEQDWTLVSERLRDFYGVAADLSRGPERFESYLPDDMRKMLDLRSEKNRMFLTPESVRTLSNDQLRRFIALMFDALSLEPWLVLNGLDGLTTRGWEPRDMRQDPVSVLATLERVVADARQTLHASGALTPERVAASAQYVRRLLGEGYLVRESPDRDGIQNLPRGARMFTAALGAVFPHVVVDGARLKVVAVDLL